MARFFAFLRRHLRPSIAACVVVVALGAFAPVYFQPHKLFINETVDDPPPTDAGTATERPGPGGSVAVLSAG
ncbi:hypothetical protein [Streptomyces sp. NPDC001070]